MWSLSISQETEVIPVALSSQHLAGEGRKLSLLNEDLKIEREGKVHQESLEAKQ